VPWIDSKECLLLHASAGFFIALWLTAGDGDRQISPGGWDGFYTYFASDAVRILFLAANRDQMPHYACQIGPSCPIGGWDGFNTYFISDAVRIRLSANTAWARVLHCI
jgi:hypothetical protein